MSKSKKAVKNIDYIVNYYKIMEIEESSTIPEIKKAYKKLSHEYHPDKFQTAGIEIQQHSKRKYSLVVEGYKILSNETHKELYDNQLEIFKKQYPNSISDNGIAIIDMTRELIDLDFLLSDQEKYEGQESFENKIKQLSGHNNSTFNIIQNAYNLNPSDEDLKKSYLDLLAHKNAYLNLMETAAYQAIGVLNKKESNPQSIDGYIDYIESEIEQHQKQFVHSIDVRLLSLDEQPLLIGMDQKLISNEMTNVYKVVTEKMQENLEKNKKQLLKIAKEKQELLSIYVKMRNYKKVHENNESKDFDVVLHMPDQSILAVFSLTNIKDNEWEPVSMYDNYPAQDISMLKDFTKTTYILEYNPEIKKVLFVVEFINDIINNSI